MGSSGGGSTSTTYTYPSWVKDYYIRANDAVWADASAAKKDNPYKDSPVDPAELLAKLGKLGEWVDNEVYAYNPKFIYDMLMTGDSNIPDTVFSILNRKEIKDTLASEASQVMRTIDEQILPKFRRGMQNIGAVNTSAFKIGEALIWSGQLEKLDELYYDRLVTPAFLKALDAADNLLDMSFKKMGLVLTYAELQYKIDGAIYQTQQAYADNWNAYRAAQLMWPIEIDKFLISAAGSWQSTPSSQTQSQKSNPISDIFSGVLGIASVAAGIFGM